MVKKILFVIVLIPFLLLWLAPKKELYFMLEKRLATQGITLSGETIIDTPIGLTLEHPTLHYKGIKIATANSIRVWSWLLYGKGTLEGLAFDPSIQRFVPKSIQKITLTHSVLKPTNISVEVADSELDGNGTIDLLQRAVHLSFPHVPASSPIAGQLKHTKGGWTYEKRF